MAEAEAMLNASRAYLIDALGRAWTAQCAEVADPTAEIVQARLATTHAMHETVRAVELVFRAAGTNAIYTQILWSGNFEISTSPSSTMPGFQCIMSRLEKFSWGCARVSRVGNALKTRRLCAGFHRR